MTIGDINVWQNVRLSITRTQQIIFDWNEPQFPAQTYEWGAYFQRKCPCTSLITSDFSVTSVIYGRNKVTFCRFCLLQIRINNELKIVYCTITEQGCDYQKNASSLVLSMVHTSWPDIQTQAPNQQQLWITVSACARWMVYGMKRHLPVDHIRFQHAYTHRTILS